MTPPKIARVRMRTIGIRLRFSSFLLPSQKVTTTKTRHAGIGVQHIHKNRQVGQRFISFGEEGVTFEETELYTRNFNLACRRHH
ncbi:hypothetical protein D3C76_512360 [compost metagenome]